MAGLFADLTVRLLLLHAFALALGYLLCRALLPLVIRAAHRYGWLDLPDGGRHAHAQPVPRLGGVAIVLATMLTFCTTLVLAPALGLPLADVMPLHGLLLPICGGALLMFVVGVLDDLFGVGPRIKLMAQGVATLLVISFGFQPHTIAVSPGGHVLELGTTLGILLTTLWVVGVTNAVNLIDGIDGLAGTMVLIALVTVVGADLIVHPTTSAVLSIGILGAVLAFLRVNWHPARIFLGDAGAMTLGFFLAIRTVLAATDTNGVTFPVVPLFALAYPLLDTFTAMARRWLRGHPFSRADGRHIHHQVRALGISTPRAVLLLALAFSCVAALGPVVVFASVRLAVTLLAVGVVLFGLLALYALRWLRYAEFLELGASVRSVLRHARIVVTEKVRLSEIAGQIGNATTLDEVRALLSIAVAESRVLDIELVAADEPMRRHGPPRQQLSPDALIPIRMEYPMVWYPPTGRQELVLRIWCARPTSADLHPAAERVAQRLGPALDHWFQTRGLHAESGTRVLTPAAGTLAVPRSTPHS